MVDWVYVVQSPAGDHFWKSWAGWDELTAVHPEENEEGELQSDEDPAVVTCEKPPAVFPVNRLNRVPEPIPEAENTPVPLSVDWVCVGAGVLS